MKVQIFNENNNQLMQLKFFFELDTLENISISIACSLGLADTFCCSKLFSKYLKFFNS